MRDLPIAYGNNSRAKFWSNKTIKWEDLCERLKTTVRTTETVEEYSKMKKADKGAAKDKGGFVGGMLRSNRRKLETVVSRSMLTMDADMVETGFVDKFVAECEYAAVLYTTHGHTTEVPRVRILLPLTEDISSDKYVALARYFAAEWGIDQFDECSYKPNQLMYWPTTPSNGEYICKVVSGEWLNPEEYLSAHPEWKDCSLLPTSSRESAVHESVQKEQMDPLSKKGIVGAFCRAYSIDDAISKFLPEVYVPSAVEGRYDFAAGEGAAGVVVYDGKFAYSHHATDPASGKLVNAFDLVRIHLFGNKDDEAKEGVTGSNLPSFKAMADFASNDEAVKKLVAEEKLEQAESDFKSNTEWMGRLQYEPRSTELKNIVDNLMLIFENDPMLKGFAFNMLANKVQAVGNLPWSRPAGNKFWRDVDTSHLIVYLDTHYGVFSRRNLEACFGKVAEERRFHPIVKYLEGLPEWDRVPRLERLFVDYLGAEDNPYVRAVTRKTFVAAVARVLEPGVKFDSVLILNGPQGVGKSTLFSRMAGEWFSDSLLLTDMKDKSAAEKLQGFWIMEMGELTGMKKADIESVKSFLSRTDDDYRPSYGRVVESHPRQCIIVGSTNAENGFLRDITGNRRFWPVAISGQADKKPWDIRECDVQQIWAETLMYYYEGEVLCLKGEVAEMAVKEQQQAMESDERQGMIEQYLDMLLPDNWDELNVYQRREYIQDTDQLAGRPGTNRRTMVSNVEIWAECFGKDPGSLKSSDSYAIAAIMAKVPGWERTKKSKRLSIYGKQRIYLRYK